MAFPLPHLEGKYEVLEKIHQGGMGEIYTARHRLLDEIRVVKVVRLDLQSDHQLQARFIREARSAVRLRHPNIAQIYDFSLDEQGAGYLVMEFIEGSNLFELFRTHGALLPSLVVEIGIQSLRALDCLHQNDFVHRDISPDNLMITASLRGEPIVKLIDLGLTKPARTTQQLTQTGMFLGKMSYASPEHFGGSNGKADVEARSDLYSLGVVLYELLTGRLPIPGNDLAKVLAGHLIHPPRDFVETDPDGQVPHELRDLVFAALAKRVEDRPKSAHAFALALEETRGIVGTVSPEILSPLIATARRGGTRAGSSTQQRIGKRFPLRPTPHDVQDVNAGRITRLNTGRIVDSRNTTIVEDLRPRGIDVERIISELQTLLETRSLDAAKAYIQELPPAAKEDARVSEILAKFSNLRSQERHLDEATRLLDRGDFEAAHTAVGEARKLGAPAQILKEFETKEAAARRDLASELLRPMEQLLGHQNWAEAREALGQARAIDPHHPELDAWQEKLEQNEELQRLEEQRVESLLALRRFLDQAKLREARQELQKARSLGVAESSLLHPANELEQAEQQAQAYLSSLPMLIERRDWTAAGESLTSAQRLGADAAEITRFHELIATERERQELERQQAVDEVMLLSERGDLEAAGRALRRAKALDVGESELREIESELKQRRTYRDQASRHLQELRTLVEKSDWPTINRIIESVQNLDPDHPELPIWTRQIAEKRESLRREAQEQAQFTREIENVQKLHRQKRVWTTYRAVQRLRKRFGDRPELQDLVNKLQPELSRQRNRLFAAVTVAFVVSALSVTFLKKFRDPAIPRIATISKPAAPLGSESLDESIDTESATLPASPQTEDVIQRPESGTSPPEQTPSEDPDPSTLKATDPPEDSPAFLRTSEIHPPLETKKTAEHKQPESLVVAGGETKVLNEPTQDLPVGTADEASKVRSLREPRSIPTTREDPPVVAPVDSSATINTEPQDSLLVQEAQEAAKKARIALAKLAKEPNSNATRLKIQGGDLLLDRGIAALEARRDTVTLKEAIQDFKEAERIYLTALKESQDKTASVALEESSPVALVEIELKAQGLSPDSLPDLERAIDLGNLEQIRLFAEPTNAWLSLPVTDSPTNINYRIGDLLIQAARNADDALVRKLAGRAALGKKARKELKTILFEAMRSRNPDLLDALKPFPIKLDRKTSVEAKTLLYEAHHSDRNVPLEQAIERILGLSRSELKELLSLSREEIEAMSAAKPRPRGIH